jgi:hypothetical protein
VPADMWIGSEAARSPLEFVSVRWGSEAGQSPVVERPTKSSSDEGVRASPTGRPIWCSNLFEFVCLGWPWTHFLSVSV